jgi:predicted transglutaminase-like cysteine proteinase
MKTTSWLFASAIAIIIALVLSASQASIDAGQATGNTVPVDGDHVHFCLLHRQNCRHIFHRSSFRLRQGYGGPP